MSIDLDIGPLSWVKGEIDLALERAGAALAAPAGKELAAACNHLHQAHGALAIVGLDGITEFSDALEQLFAALAAGQVSDVGNAVGAAQDGLAALRGYLDGLMAGEPNQPLKLLPAYSALLTARGLPAPGALALFFPDLTQRPPRREVELPALDAEKFAARIKLARMGYERGLLKWLKGDAKGLAEMRNSVNMIEMARQQPAERAFWWVGLGFFAALAGDGLPDATEAKKLAMKIGAQIKKLGEGQAEVADRLLAEALYQVAIASGAAAGHEQVALVRSAYRLDELIPRSANADIEAMRPQLRRLRELLAGAKDDWNRLCAGSAAALPPFHEKATQLAERGGGLGRDDISALLDGISRLADALRRDPSRHSDTMALEVATALLVADTALENFESLDSIAADFAHQAAIVVRRLDASLRGEALGELELPHLDTLSRRAQERLLLASVAREIRSNLAQIEQTLDGYFRDSAQAATRAALAGLPAPLKQVEGALAVLGQERACAVLRDCGTMIAALAASGGDAGAFEDLAQKLSALGFFVEQLELGGQPDIDLILAPRQKTEAAPPPTPPAPPAPPVVTEPDAASPAPSFTSAADTALADELAQLLPPPAEIEPALTASAAPRAAPPPSAQSVRLAEASNEEVDAELLDIFLEEAREVLATIAENLPRLHAAPGDDAALTTLRRSVHTLKGSGRMVGLNELGESAWGVEQVLNQWMQAHQPASPLLLELLDDAAALYSSWVARLDQRALGHPDPAPLAALCKRLLGGESEPAASDAPAAVAPAAAAVEESTSDILAQLEARELARDLAAAAVDIDAAELAAQEAMAEAEEALMPLPATPMVDLADIVDFDLDLPPPVGAEPVAATPVAPPEPPTAPELPATPQPPTLAEAPPPAPPPLATEPPPPPVSDVRPFPAPPPVQVGELAISATLFPLYMDEARGHLDAIQAAIGAHGVPGSALIRAAHTLGSISGTTGVNAIHHLARALEQALERLAIAATPPTDAQRFVFARCAGALEGMLGAVANRRLPGPEAELAAALAAMQPEPGAPTAEFSLPAAETGSTAKPPTAAEERPESLEERRARRMDDDIDAQLLPLFLEESIDLMQRIGSGLRTWRGAPADDAVARQLQRDLHTLKGSARMAGAMGCGELLHSMESRIEQAVAMRAVSPEMLDSLETSFDRGEFLIDRLRHGDFNKADDKGDDDVAIDHGEASPLLEEQTAPTLAATAIATSAVTAAAAAGQVHLRVRADLVDRLVNEAGEVAISRARIEGEMRTLKASLLELTDNVIRLRGQVREIEIQAETQMQAQMSVLRAQAEEAGTAFDPLEFDRFTRFQELTRMMAESVNDVSTVQHTLLKNLDGADAALAAQARLNRELSQRLMSVRMVPFESLAERLHRVVRQAAKDAGKRANLDIRGGQTGIDRSVLEKIGGPLEHLLRNAVAHGIETAAVREAAGKDALGQITVSLAQEGNDVVITLADDGGGLDFARIRSKAIAQGLLTEHEEADEKRLAGLIFESGISTATEVTALAGRGVGMDVVKNEIEALGGRIEISTTLGRGSSFRLYLPLTLAISQAVIIQAGGRNYALPSSMVEQASELKPEAIAKVRLEGGTEWLGRRYPWHYLPRLLGEAHAQPIPARRHWLVLIKGGTERIALEVDGLAGNEEIVIKAIGPQLARVPGVAGATVLGDGEIALILNPIALVMRGAARHAAAVAANLVETQVPALTDTQILREIKPVGCVMVVDDSLTVRKITGRLLGRQGYNVVTAKDGVDALEQLADLLPDVMLVDIEMPRMDGFELSRNIRADQRLRNIPIIMITSRSAEKHRQYAREIGVDHYLGKPYDEEQLLALVAGYTQKESTP